MTKQSQLICHNFASSTICNFPLPAFFGGFRLSTVGSWGKRDKPAEDMDLNLHGGPWTFDYGKRDKPAEDLDLNLQGGTWTWIPERGTSQRRTWT